MLVKKSKVCRLLSKVWESSLHDKLFALLVSALNGHEWESKTDKEVQGVKHPEWRFEALTLRSS